MPSFSDFAINGVLNCVLSCVVTVVGEGWGGRESGDDDCGISQEKCRLLPTTPGATYSLRPRQHSPPYSHTQVLSSQVFVYLSLLPRTHTHTQIPTLRLIVHGRCRPPDNSLPLSYIDGYLQLYEHCGRMVRELALNTKVLGSNLG